MAWLIGAGNYVDAQFQRDNPQTKSIVKAKRKYLLFPVIVKSPEYLWGAGVAGTLYFKLGHDSTTRSSNVKVVSFYTLRNQLVFGSESTFFFPSENFIFRIPASYSHFPDRFWGIGNNTPSSNMEKYDIFQASATPQLLRKLFSDFYVGVGYDFQDVFQFNYNMDGTSLFDKENVTGRYGGKISGATFLLVFDSRDNAFSSTKGLYAQYLITRYDQSIGSNFDFTVQVVDIRKYLSLKKNRILAFQFNLISNVGNVPVRSLASMGSSSYQRGYYDGRYADKNMIALQAEYRTPVYRRFGAVLFAGAGKVGAHFDELWDFSSLKPSVGFGVRYSLNPKERLNLRVDAGWGQESQGTYINLGEAF
jgi:hypothetical protein